MIAGGASPNSLTDVIVKTPASNEFTVSVQAYGSTEAKEAKKYDSTTLGAIATTENAGRGFLFNPDLWNVGVTTKFVEVNKLLSDAGLTLEANDKLVFKAPDGFESTMTAEQVNAEKYFYPAATGKGTDTTGAVEVGTVLALNWQTAATTETAGAAVKELADGTLITQYRVFCGLSEANYKALDAAGKRFATNPKSLTLIKGEPVAAADTKTETSATASASAIDLSKAKVSAAKQTYNGKAKKPAPKVVLDGKTLVKGTDYTVAYKNNKKAGKATMTITGKDAYTGTATGTFTIAKAAQKVTVKTKSKTYKASKVKKAQSFKIGVKASGKGKLSYKVTSKDSKKKVTFSKGKVTVKAGTKAGTYKVKVKITAKANANYKKATKTITIKVVVK